MSNLNDLAANQEIVYEELPLPEESEAEVIKNQKIFCENLDLILKHSDQIIARPEFFYIRHSWMMVGAMYVGSNYIPLGVLLLLWQSGRWTTECLGCGGKAYIYKIAGSPLSGSHYCHAFCPVCAETLNSKQSKGFTVLMKQALDLSKTYNQKRKILRTKGPRFSWRNGTVGEKVPDKILEDLVVPVSLTAIIKCLREQC